MARSLLPLYVTIFASCFLFVAAARPIRGLTGAVPSTELIATGEGGEAPPSTSSTPEKGGEGVEAEPPEKKQVVEESRHRSSRTSMAGGGIVIGGEDVEAEAPEKEVAEESRHRPSRTSMAGGEIIIGGLVMATLAAVFCYIRITRKKRTEEGNC